MWGRIKNFFRARRLKSTIAGLNKLSANDAHKLKEWLSNDHAEGKFPSETVVYRLFVKSPDANLEETAQAYSEVERISLGEARERLASGRCLIREETDLPTLQHLRNMFEKSGALVEVEAATGQVWK